MSETQQKLWDYFILCARFLLAYMLLSYGWGKLTDSQFGITPEEIALPVKDLSLFRLSWYFFDHQPFKAFIGVSQVIAGLLLMYNRTLLIGALMAIPIWANILVVDITYVKMEGFYWRLSYYLLLDFLILWHYRERMIPALKMITSGVSTKFRFPWWAYVILPVMIVVLELAGALPKILISLIIHPSETMYQLGRIPGILQEVAKHILH